MSALQRTLSMRTHSHKYIYIHTSPRQNNPKQCQKAIHLIQSPLYLMAEEFYGTIKLQDLKPIMFQPNCKPFCTDYWCVNADIVCAQLWCLNLHMHAHMPDQQLLIFKLMLYLASNILLVGCPLLVQVSPTRMHLYKRSWRMPIIWN
jgi:hypothetical protein